MKKTDDRTPIGGVSAPGGKVSPRPSGRKWQAFLWWVALAAAAVVAGRLAQSINLPGGWVIGPLLAGIGFGLARPTHPRMPPRCLMTAQAVIGMVLAGTFRPEAVPLVAAHWFPVLLTVVTTLGVSVAAGAVLGRFTSLDRETATFGTIPGGAGGMVMMSLDSKADTRLVALMQYMRVVLVVVSAALLARFVLHPAGPAHPPPLVIPAGPISPNLWLGSLLTPILAAFGAWGGLRLRLPAGALIGPLVLGIAASGLNLFHPAWPPGVAQAAFIVVGVFIGLLFDRAALRQAGRSIPAMLASTLILMAVCAGTGAMLSAWVGVDYLTGYLATTPGGMDSITVVGLSSGADVSFMLAVQMARVLTMVLIGPPLVRWLSNG
jgi:uncharacterized protein